MASPTTPTHGKLAMIYRLRPNGFKGAGLNDLTHNASASMTDSSYFEIMIDANGTPDTFKWRENGGAWTEDVAITGAAQTLSGANGDASVAFAATIGHTIGDQWSIGHLKDEPTTESSAEAQVTDAALRVLNPNATLVWSDTGGETVLETYHSDGRAKFTGNVTVVTLTGDNGFILRSGLQKVGYLYEWQFSIEVPLADTTAMQDDWESGLLGISKASGSAGSCYIGDQCMFETINESEIFYLEMFNYDPDDDQTGDHWRVWANMTGLDISAQKGDVVKGPFTLDIQGLPAFIANA